MSLIAMINWLTKAQIPYLVKLCIWRSDWFITMLSTELYTNREQFYIYDAKMKNKAKELKLVGFAFPPFNKGRRGEIINNMCSYGSLLNPPSPSFE